MKHLSLIHAENLFATIKSRGWTPDVDTYEFVTLNDFRGLLVHDLVALLHLINQERDASPGPGPSDILY